MWTTLWLLACITTEDIDARLDPDDDGVEGDDDCAPENADVHPGADEVCNGVDDDCDRVTDGAAALDAVEGFEDRDADGFGGATRKDCPGAASFVTTGGDCDDGQAQVRPGALEVCNGVDDDCDSATGCRSAGVVAASLATGWARQSFEGRALAAVGGDFDGDGSASVAVGTDSGVVLEYGHTGDAANGPLSLRGSLPFSIAQGAHLLSSDVDGDGLDDLIIQPSADAHGLLVAWGAVGPLTSAGHTVVIAGSVSPSRLARMAVIPGTDLQAPQLIATALLDGSPTLLGWQVTRTSAPAPSDADFSAALPAASWTPVAVRGLHGEASRDVVIVADSIEEPPAVRVARWEDVEESQPLALQGRALSWGDPGEPVAEPVQCDLTGDGVADWMTGSKGSGAFAPHHVSVVSAASLSGTANLTALAGFDGLLPNAALVDVGIADLDHDGVCDLAVLQHSSGGFKVGVHFGPFPWPRSELSAFDTVFELDALPLTSATLVSGDLDGDGFLDLVAFVSDAAMWTMTGLPP